MAHSDDVLVAALLRDYGRTYAEECDIRLADKPGPLYQLLVLTSLLGKPISSKVATAAARELFRAGLRTPRAMVDASPQDRVGALGRGHYRRYDESTSRLLGAAAQHCLDHWGGDLRRMRREAGGDRRHLSQLLTQFPGIGPTAADIFIREVQAVWPEYQPSLDAKVSAGALKIHLEPSSIDRIAESRDIPRLTSALVRVGLARRLPDDVKAEIS
jgi:hypothetical protein